MPAAATAMTTLRTIERPPVPSDCSMKGLSYIPLEIDRLKRSRSWARAGRIPYLGYYLINQWTAAWQQVPAGSLEDDDDVLCAAAQCPTELWADVRDEVLGGWLRCSDGRLYHPVICELATGVWQSRQAYRDGTARARAAKAAKRGSSTTASRPVIHRDPDTPASAPDLVPAHQSASASIQPGLSLRDSVDNPDNDLNSLNIVEGPSSAPELQQTFKYEVISKEKGEAPLMPPQQKNTRGTRLADNWEPGADGYLFAAGLGLMTDEVFAAFRDHYQATPGLRGRSLDWSASFREWCRGAHLRQQRARPNERREQEAALRLQQSLGDPEQREAILATMQWQAKRAADGRAFYDAWIAEQHAGAMRDAGAEHGQ
jgi:hypothetical protein